MNPLLPQGKFLKQKSGVIKYQLNAFDEVMYDTIDPISNKITELVELQLLIAKEEFDASQLAYEETLLEVISFIVAAIILSALVGFMMTRGLIRQLGGEPQYALDIISQIAEGDMTTDIATRKDDSSSILYSVKNMSDRLTAIIRDVRSSAISLTGASEQVSATAQVVSQATTEQASSVEETSASVEQMAASVEQNGGQCEIDEWHGVRYLRQGCRWGRSRHANCGSHETDRGQNRNY